MILLLFDSYKLDISDEFRGVIENLRNQDDKVHCVMNKADQLDPESLMKVYGALLWSMGKIFQSAEVPRVYCGSFRDEQLLNEHFRGLFDKDRNALMAHLKDLPRMCGMRKVNEMVKRIRLNIVHVCLLGHLRSKMPLLFGKEAQQKVLIASLDQIYLEVQRTYNLPAGDFPPLDEFRSNLMLCHFSKFPPADREVLTELKDMLSTDIPKIFKQIAGIASRPGAGGGGDQVEDDESKNASLKAMLNFDFETPKSGDMTMIVAGLIAITLVIIIVALAATLVATNKRNALIGEL